MGEVLELVALVLVSVLAALVVDSGAHLVDGVVLASLCALLGGFKK